MSQHAGERGAVGGLPAALIQARWNAVQMVRGRIVWVAAIFAALPVGYALLAGMNGAGQWSEVFVPLVILVALVAPLFMASSMAEEIEDRTYTYLWSRPVPRWSVVLGKLLAAFPIAGAVVVVAAVGGFALGRGGSSGELASGIVALLVGTLAACAVSAAFAILVPRAGLAITYIYLVALDLPIGAIPFSIRNASITHHIRTVAGLSGLEQPPPLWSGVAGIAAVSAFWLAIAFLRLRRAEFSSGEK